MRAVIIPLLFLAVMTAGAGARGETGGSVFIEELTWTELRDQIAAGKTIAIVPKGEVDRPSGHLRFPGTITVPEDTFEKTIESAARSLQLHGFRDIVFLGDHGSTQTGEEAV